MLFFILLSIAVIRTSSIQPLNAWSVFSFNCSQFISESPHDLYHLPTGEGLISQYWQAEELWKLDKIVGLKKNLKLVTFRGHHYNYEHVVICDMFVFPSNIECICELEDEVGRHEKYCPILPAGFAADERMYGLNLSTNTAKTANVDLKNVTCFAGFVYTLRDDPFYKEAMKKLPTTPSFPIVFQQKFLQLADFVRNLHSLKPFLSKPTIVVHWRRGDQLHYRCGATDHSVNCGGPAEFIAQIRNDTKSYAHANHTVFVATNEANVTILQALHSVGYLTHINITNALLDTGHKLTMVELFGLDFIFMCQAKVFLFYGVSDIHRRVTQYRVENKVNSEFDTV